MLSCFDELPITYDELLIMSKTILITGSSSGIGKETVKLFQTKGWNVAATMRTPAKATDLQNLPNVALFRLDVTDENSIREAIAEAIQTFGKIDAIVNNAGYGLVGAFEASSNEQIEKQFQTNVFGVMNVCREILPVFRAQKSGIIVNVASMGGRITFPLYSLYHATKWAVEGFSESLQYEVEPFGIRVKIIEPGPIKTDFYDRSMDLTRKEGLTAYDDFINQAMPNMQKAGENAPDGKLVANVIYQAVTDNSKKMRYTANSAGILTARKFLPDGLFFSIVRNAVLKK